MARTKIAPNVEETTAPNTTHFFHNEYKKCTYNEAEKDFLDQMNKKLRTETDVSFLRPKVLSDCMNLAQKAHEKFLNIDPEILNDIFALKDNNLKISDFLKLQSNLPLNIKDPMLKCDFNKIIADDSVQEMLEKCHVCEGSQTDSYHFTNIYECYNVVSKLDIVKRYDDNN